MIKPPISLDAFSRLMLQVGTVLSTQELSEVPDLSVVEVQIEGPVEAITPTSGVSASLVGRQVVVAGLLHPLTICAKSYRHSLLTDRLTVLVVANRVPDGIRLH